MKIVFEITKLRYLFVAKIILFQVKFYRWINWIYLSGCLIILILLASYGKTTYEFYLKIDEKGHR